MAYEQEWQLREENPKYQRRQAERAAANLPRLQQPVPPPVPPTMEGAARTVLQGYSVEHPTYPAGWARGNEVDTMALRPLSPENIQKLNHESEAPLPDVNWSFVPAEEARSLQAPVRTEVDTSGDVLREVLDRLRQIDDRLHRLEIRGGHVHDLQGGTEDYARGLLLGTPAGSERRA